MTIWEKAVLNMQRGTQRITIAAAVFAERVQAELAIIRLRIRIEEVQDRINELYQDIGRRVVNITRGEALPKMCEELVQDEEIALAMNELTDRKQELVELHYEIKNKQVPIKPIPKRTEGDTK